MEDTEYCLVSRQVKCFPRPQPLRLSHSLVKQSQLLQQPLEPLDAHTQTHTDTLTQIHLDSHTTTYTHACTHECTHTCTHTQIHSYTHTHASTRAHTHTHTHAHTHTHTHTHTHPCMHRINFTAVYHNANIKNGAVFHGKNQPELIYRKQLRMNSL